MLALGSVLLGIALVVRANLDRIDDALTGSVGDWIGPMEGDTTENWLIAGVGIVVMLMAGPVLVTLVSLWFAAVVYFVGHGTFRIVRWLTSRDPDVHHDQNPDLPQGRPSS